MQISTTVMTYSASVIAMMILGIAVFGRAVRVVENVPVWEDGALQERSVVENVPVWEDGAV